MATVLDFYDPMAPYYHLIFEDWDSTIERQAGVLDSLLRSQVGASPLRVLDCACGIGTQAIGFAQSGHHVTASDLSPNAVARAKQEAEARGLSISFHVADMTSLGGVQDGNFDVVAALDNALPHLSAEMLRAAVGAMGAKLRRGGLFLASTRDYDTLIRERPTIQRPVFYGEALTRRIIHQVWDWIDHERYAVHHYITVQSAKGWEAHHFVSVYRCVQREELTSALQATGYQSIRWLMPTESGYFQPLVVATKI